MHPFIIDRALSRFPFYEVLGAGKIFTLKEVKKSPARQSWWKIKKHEKKGNRRVKASYPPPAVSFLVFFFLSASVCWVHTILFFIFFSVHCRRHRALLAVAAQTSRLTFF